MIIQSDASLTEWGAVSNFDQTSIPWLEKGQTRKPCTKMCWKKVDFVFLHQREKNESHTHSDRQQGSLSLPFENGTNNKRAYDQINKKNLALSSK